MTEYTITPSGNVDNLKEIIKTFPNYVRVAFSSVQLFAEFNHANNQEIKAFLWQLAEVTDGIVTIDPQGVNRTVTLSQFNKALRHDMPFLTEVYNRPLSLGAVYENVFPNAINNYRIPVDTNGFTMAGIAVVWDKNGGAGTHDLKIVDRANEAQTLKEFTNMSTGMHEDYIIDLETTAGGHFDNKTLFLKVMARSSNPADNPIIVGLRVYMRR